MKQIDLVTQYKDWYRLLANKELDLDNPKTLKEKFHWLKIYDNLAIKTELTDKYRVRGWVKEKIGDEYLVPLLGVWENANDIDFSSLPERYVLKCNHGCGWNVIVRDKRELKIPEAIEKLNNWLKLNYAYRSLEFNYRNIKPLIIAEEYIENAENNLIDYKFFCFNNEVKFCHVIIDRHTNPTNIIYDQNWQPLDFILEFPKSATPIAKPDNYTEMINIANTLCQGFKFIRIDLYSNNGKIYFGETTFYPNAGNFKTTPSNYNLILSEYLDIEKDTIDPNTLVNSLDYYPLISICIATYNRAKWLKEAIESCLNQTYDNYEIVVIDDGSTDETAEIVGDSIYASRKNVHKHNMETGRMNAVPYIFENKDGDKIRYYYQENRGFTKTCNELVKKARGEYILKLDDDDLLCPNIVEEYTKAIIHDWEIDIIYGNQAFFNGDPNTTTRVSENPDLSNNEKNIRENFFIQKNIGSVGICIRKSLIEKAGYYDEAFIQSQDFDLLSRIVPSSKVFKINKELVKRRIHGDRVSGGQQVNTSFHSLVLKKILATNSLEEIFLSVDWNDPDALRNVYFKIATGFFMYKDYYTCIKVLESISPSMKVGEESVYEMCIKALIGVSEFQNAKRHLNDIYQITQNEKYLNISMITNKLYHIQELILSGNTLSPQQEDIIENIDKYLDIYPSIYYLYQATKQKNEKLRFKYFLKSSLLNPLNAFKYNDRVFQQFIITEAQRNEYEQSIHRILKPIVFYEKKISINNIPNKKVVYTCISGGHNDLVQHKYCNQDYEYICFTDNNDLLSQGKCGIWHIRPLLFTKLDDHKNSRWHKILPHIIFPEYEQSIWVDANINILSDYIFKIFAKKNKHGMYIQNHSERNCIYKEIEAVRSLGYETENALENINKLLSDEKFPQHYGLTDNSIIYREHHDTSIIDLMERWWYFIENYSRRDQLSFSYVLWKKGIKPLEISFQNIRYDEVNVIYEKHKKRVKYNTLKQIDYTKNRPTVILVQTIGGLTDIWLKQMSLFLICQKLGYDFKIHYKEPFDMEDYLTPNIYDWTVSNDVYEAAIKEKNVLESENMININDVESVLVSRIAGKKYLVWKTYIASYNITKTNYAHTHNTLFKPTDELQKVIDHHLNRLGGEKEYISAVFRFQQLLGDFEEPGFPILNITDRNILIQRCISALKELAILNRGDMVLVTSDSITFLQEAKKLGFVYVVPEKILHPEANKKADKNVWMKSFLDYYLLTKSKKNYLIIDGKMYNSGFPRHAASHGNIPYEVLNLNKINYENAVKELKKHIYKKEGCDEQTKDRLTKKTLSYLYATRAYFGSDNGLEIYQKLQDEESRVIYTEFFYHHFVAENNWYFNYRAHYCNILSITLQSRLKEKINISAISPSMNGEEINDIFFFGEQYFDLPALKSIENEVFIDAGALQGDSIEGFLKFCNGQYKHIYSFEPEQKNYNILCENVKKWNVENVTLIPKGLYNRNCVLSFSEKSQRIDENGNIKVPVTTLDDYLDVSETVTFIKMDIEGAELEALFGAANIIKRCKPRLAICIYHKPTEDFINIPAYLLKLVPQYKFYVRHYSYSLGDTILYAVIEPSRCHPSVNRVKICNDDQGV